DGRAPQRLEQVGVEGVDAFRHAPSGERGEDRGLPTYPHTLSQRPPRETLGRQAVAHDRHARRERRIAPGRPGREAAAALAPHLLEPPPRAGVAATVLAEPVEGPVGEPCWIVVRPALHVVSLLLLELDPAPLRLAAPDGLDLEDRER